MRIKSFIIGLLSLIAVSALLIVFGQQKPTSIQNFVSTTHQQLRNIKDTFRETEPKSFTVDDKYLMQLGFNDTPRLYPSDIWHNSSLPVIVTYVREGQESQAVGLINNIARILPNNSVLVYNLGLGNYGLRTLLTYCNNSKCRVISFSLDDFPSYVQDDNFHAFRPIIIQDALHHTGAVFFLESNRRFRLGVITSSDITSLFESISSARTGSGIVAWPMQNKNAVSSLTHKKMFDYFRTDADSFIFLPMVTAEALMVVNTRSIHRDVMLAWLQCTLTHDCIVPIGAQSGGCRFDKKPQYRYSGCHSYDVSALNIILGVKFKLDNVRYTFQGTKSWFATVELDKAVAALKSFEQNSTTDSYNKITKES